MTRVELELKAAATIELRRRQLLKKTVYGIYSPDKTLLRSWVEQDGIYTQTNDKPVISIPEKLEPLLIKKKRFKVAFGGRGSGKSMGFGKIFTSKGKDYKEKTACFRELQNSIDDSVHALLKAEIESTGYDCFDVTDTAIKINGKDVFKYRGLSRNSEAVKSMFGFKYGWVEEAQNISKDSLKDLTPTFREDDAELWFSLNPQSSEDPIAQRFIKPFESELLKNGYYEDDLHLIIVVNYEDNPWFPETLESERQWDKANLPRAMYDHIWLGAYNDSVENSLIKAEWFDACVDAHKKLRFKPSGVKLASHDPSDMGGDSKGYAMRHGSVFLDVQEKMSGDVNEGCDWATGLAITQGVDQLIWDCDGLGVSLSRQVDQSLDGKRITPVMFKGSESVDFPDSIYEPSLKTEMQGQKTNKDIFKNKRAQYYGMLRDRIYRTYLAVTKGEFFDPDLMISFGSGIKSINKLKSELCRLPVKPNGNGKLELYTKQEMKTKFKMNSPNLSDSVMMNLRYINITRKEVRIPKPMKAVRR